MRVALAWLTGLAVVVAGVLLLRTEVMTVHTDQPPGSQTAFALHAATREHPRHLPEMTRGLVSVCRLLVNGDVLERSFTDLGGGRFAFSVEPALDQFDLREMQGCLQDTRVQRLLVKVTDVQTRLPARGARS